MYAEYKASVSLLNVLNHAWLSGFFATKKCYECQKHFCSNLFRFTQNPDVHSKFCNGIALSAKKSSGNVLSHFWQIFLIALRYEFFTWIKTIRKDKAALYIWKKYIILSLYLNENICVKLFRGIKEDVYKIIMKENNHKQMHLIEKWF